MLPRNMDMPPEMKEPGSKEWRSFWLLITIQIQNAFNEKTSQLLLIPLAGWLFHMKSEMEYLLGAIIVLPYILFAPIVGWLADFFCKTRIIQCMAFLQIVVMGLMWYCLIHHNLTWAIIWFCVFATQATTLSPARKGVIKDMMGSQKIGLATGIVEMAGIFALLAAQVVSMFWFDYLLRHSGDGWFSAAEPSLILLLVAIPIALASLKLPKYRVTKTRPFSPKIFYEHFIQLKFLWKRRDLRLSEIGISYFWFLAGVLALISIQVGKEATNGGQGMGTMVAVLSIWLSGGVILGGTIASLICRRKIELGLVPLGAIGVTLGCIYMAFFPPMSLPSNIGFAFIGGCAAVYLVPLNAFLLDRSDADSRGNVIAAGNLMDMLMGLVAVGFQMALQSFLPIQDQFIVLAVTSLVIAVTGLRLIPREFIRMLGLGLAKSFYRGKILNQERIPEYGGVLIVANHVTYADAIFLSMVCPRPIRFIVAEEFVAIRWLGWILELFNCLPISTRNPREAISKSIKALRDGEVICLFPEGQLTRTGTLCVARRGVELLVRKSGAPVIPVYMDGLWGSIFSYSGNRFFSKFPSRIPGRFTVAIGEPLAPEHFSSASVTNALRSLSAECLEASVFDKDYILKKLISHPKRSLVISKNGSLSGAQIAACLLNRSSKGLSCSTLGLWIDKLLEISENENRFGTWLLNATQIQRVNALLPGEPLLTTIGLHESHEPVIAILWPILTGTSVYLLSDKDDSIPSSVKQMAGSLYLRKRLQKLVPQERTPLFDFSRQADIILPNIDWKPCYSNSTGTVLAMSMCKGVFKMDDGTVQLGIRPRTRGRLLPGFYMQEHGICGPALDQECYLPENLYLDESGFLAELQSVNQEG